MKRWMPSRPRFDTPVRLLLHRRGAASEVGVQRRGSTRARILKAFASSSASAIPAPTATPPDSESASPSGPWSGWTAWWPEGSTVIPDPPTTDRPVLPTPDAPILWEASALIGGSGWDLSIGAVFARVHWQPRTGNETMTGDIELAESLAVAKMRGSIFAIAKITAKEWCLQRVDDNSIWDIENIVPSFRRGEFVEMVVRRSI